MSYFRISLVWAAVAAGAHAVPIDINVGRQQFERLRGQPRSLA